MEQPGRGFDKPKSPEHRDAYLALTQHCTRLVETHALTLDDGVKSTDLGLDGDKADFEIDIPADQSEEVITNLTRRVNTEGDEPAPITFYTQTMDEIWRKKEYPSWQDFMAAFPAGKSFEDMPGTFDEVYGPALEPADVYDVLTEVLAARPE